MKRKAQLDRQPVVGQFNDDKLTQSLTFILSRAINALPEFHYRGDPFTGAHLFLV